MIELSEENHATAKKRAAKFEDGSADDVVQLLFESLRHEEGSSAPFLGLRVSKNVALTPNDSGLAQAVRESSLPIETRELFIRGNEYLLFARPPGREDRSQPVSCRPSGEADGREIREGV